MADNIASPEQMIAEYKEVARKRSFAKMCVSVAVVGVIVIYVLTIWQSVKELKDNRLPELSAAIGTEFAAMAPKMMTSVEGMFTRLCPLYGAAFQKSATVTWPKLHTSLDKEYNALENSALEQWPAIKDGVMSLAQVQEAVVMTELKGTLNAADAERISEVYGKALRQKYEELVSSGMGKNTDSIIYNSQQIGTIVKDMAKNDQEFSGKPMDMTRVVGILLEMVGVQIQQAK